MARFICYKVDGTFTGADCYQGDAKEHQTPSGYAGVLGPMDDDSAAAVDAFANPSHYTVQAGVLVKTVTDAQLLAESQAAQKTAITHGLNATLAGGFTAKYNGHSYVSGMGGQLNTEGDLKRFELDSTLTTVQFFTIDAGWIAHTHADLQAIFLEGGRWKDAQYAQAQNLTAQVNAQTSIPATPVTWTAATSW